MNSDGDPGPRIRPYRRETDFEGMFAVTREILSLPPYEEARRELAEYPSKQVAAFVAEDAGETIVGYCAASHPYWNRIAVIDYLVVAPAWRGQRLGERLVRETEAALRDAGIRRVCVQTISWNERAVRFYRRLGYAERARLPGYFDDEHEMVWLDRILNTPEQ